MPRRYVETEIRYQLKTGCVRFPIPAPRPVTVIQDPWSVRVARLCRCRLLLLRRWWTRWTR